MEIAPAAHDTERIEIRGLTRRDDSALRAHVLRLDMKDRFLRFCGILTDDAVHRFIDRLDWSRGLLVGCFVDGALRGVVQVSPVPGVPGEAEFAITVDREYRRRGCASALMREVVAGMEAHGICRLVMYSMNDNEAIGQLARKFGFDVRPFSNQMFGAFALPGPVTC